MLEVLGMFLAFPLLIVWAMTQDERYQHYRLPWLIMLVAAPALIWYSLAFPSRVSTWFLIMSGIVIVQVGWRLAKWLFRANGILAMKYRRRRATINTPQLPITAEQAWVGAGMIVVTFVLLWTVLELQKAISSLGWPTTQGRVISSQANIADEGFLGHADVSYNYTVNRTAYIGNTVSFGLSTVFSIQAYAIADQYPVAMTVLVHYNPQNPRISVLEPKISANFYVPLVGIAIGYTLLIRKIRTWRR